MQVLSSCSNKAKLFSFAAYFVVYVVLYANLLGFVRASVSDTSNHDLVIKLTLQEDMMITFNGSPRCPPQGFIPQN